MLQLAQADRVRTGDVNDEIATYISHNQKLPHTCQYVLQMLHCDIALQCSNAHRENSPTHLDPMNEPDTIRSLVGHGAHVATKTFRELVDIEGNLHSIGVSYNCCVL